MSKTATLALVLGLAAAAWRFGSWNAESISRGTSHETVVFVGELSGVKILTSASLFKQVAGRHGLRHAALARHLGPETGVPAMMASAPLSDGIDTADLEASALIAIDVSSASRVIAIDVNLTVFGARARAPIEEWNDIPDPGVDPIAAGEAIRGHIDALVADLVAAH